VVLFTLPFHGARTPRQALFGGQLFPCPRIDRTNEGVAHAIHDLRVALRYVRELGRGPIGLMGLSLGGYVSALLSGLGDPLSFLVMMVPLADLTEMLWEHGEGHPERERAERLGLTREILRTLYTVHAPLRLEPGLPPERVLIVAGRGDAVCPRSQTELLWRHFGGPRVHWFPGAHAAHFRRAQLLETLGNFAGRWFEEAPKGTTAEGEVASA
jgi:acetyl esterase/lipase